MHFKAGWDRMHPYPIVNTTIAITNNEVGIQVKCQTLVITELNYKMKNTYITKVF